MYGRSYTKILGLVLTVGFLVNCNHAKMEPQQQPAPVAPQGPVIPGAIPAPAKPTGRLPKKGAPGISQGVCKPSEVKSDKIVKVLFVVDASGSNFGANGSIPSDPKKQWRTETLRQFITSKVNDKNFFFGMTLFKGASSKSLININNEPGFSNERNVVAEGFRSFVSTKDGGNTPYRAALRMAKNIIANDMEDNAKDNASYAVVMVSDGRATDYKRADDVIPDASAIKELAPDRITLNSVYYSSKKIDRSAPQYLKSIANIGEGAFVTANTSESLKLGDVIKVSIMSCR